MKIKKNVLEINNDKDKNLYDILKRNIVEGNLLPGNMMSEEFIKNSYTASRTMIRETLIKLSKENLVEIIPQKGTYVSKINLKNIKDYLYLRKLTEEQIYREAVDIMPKDSLTELKMNLEIQKSLLSHGADPIKLLDMDNRFHKIIFDSVGRKNVWDMLGIFQIEYDRLRILTLKEGLTQEAMLGHHSEIIKNLEEKKTDIFKSLNENHLGNFDKLYGKVITKYKDYFIE